MKIIEKKGSRIINEVTIERGKYTFDLKKSAHLYNNNYDCLGYIPNHLVNGYIELECETTFNVVRVSIFYDKTFITLIDYREVSIVEIE